MSNLSHLGGSTIELLISCTGLADLDQFTKSDPMCVLFIKQFGQWKEYGRTEAIANTLNPKSGKQCLIRSNKYYNKFTQSFLLDYKPGVQQSLLMSVYDIDSRSTDLKHHDLVGSVELSLTDLLDETKHICTVCKTLRAPGDARARGIISITSEALRPSNDSVSFHVAGHKLTKKGKLITFKPDVYLEISRSIDNVSYHPVFRTEIVHKSRNPRWRPFDITLQRLCNGDWDRLLQFVCWHHSGSGDYKLLGRKISTLREMNIMKRENHYLELNLMPKKDKEQKNSVKLSSCGFLRFFQFRVDCQYSLLDFVRGGLQLQPIVGIDFTSSNGRPGEELCLHDLNGENKYMEVIESLAAVVSQYNIDQHIAMFGFGAKLNASQSTSHCFPLTQDDKQIQVQGLNSAIDLYKTAVEKLHFGGPSRLKPILAMAEAMAVREPSQERQVYHVLIIITDGIINDIDESIERILSISHLPLSIVFVGVGPADFSLMEPFSFHSVHPLSHGTWQASRRNTHFVSFQTDGERTAGNEVPARDALAVLSSQILDYMKARDITPNRRRLPIPVPASQATEDIIAELNTTQTKHPMSRAASTVSVNSLRVSEISAPKCPTCGSTVESGVELHTGLTSVM